MSIRAEGSEWIFCFSTLLIKRIEHRKWNRGRNGLHQLGQPVAPSILFPGFNPPYPQGRSFNAKLPTCKTRKWPNNVKFKISRPPCNSIVLLTQDVKFLSLLNKFHSLKLKPASCRAFIIPRSEEVSKTKIKRPLDLERFSVNFNFGWITLYDGQNSGILLYVSGTK